MGQSSWASIAIPICKTLEVSGHGVPWILGAVATMVTMSVMNHRIYIHDAYRLTLFSFLFLFFLFGGGGGWIDLLSEIRPEVSLECTGLSCELKGLP